MAVPDLYAAMQAERLVEQVRVLRALPDRLDYEGAFSLLLRHWGSGQRLEPFLGMAQRVSDVDYWRLLGEVWTGADFVYRSLPVWRSLFQSERPFRLAVMTADERERWFALPERVELHRGYSRPRGHRGMAWTLDRERAEWFARRFEPLNGFAEVASTSVPSQRVLALFDERGESEAVLAHLHGLRFQHVRV